MLLVSSVGLAELKALMRVGACIGEVHQWLRWLRLQLPMFMLSAMF